MIVTNISFQISGMILDIELKKEQLREEEKSLDNSKENIDAQPKKKRKPQKDNLLDQLTYEEEITDFKS